VPKSQVAYLLDRIGVVAGVQGSDAAAGQFWNTEDLSDVSLETATFLRDALDVPALERELVSRSQVDAKTLTEVAAWFSSVAQEAPPPFAMTFPDGTTFGWEAKLQRIQELVAGLEDAHGHRRDGGWASARPRRGYRVPSITHGARPGARTSRSAPLR
jgi:hypothetical protein